MPLADIIRQEFAPTATSVHQMEASVRNNSQTLTTLQTTVTALAQSVNTRQQSMSTTVTAFKWGILHLTSRSTAALPPDPAPTLQEAVATDSVSAENRAVVDLTAGTGSKHSTGEGGSTNVIPDSKGVNPGVNSADTGGVITDVNPTDPATDGIPDTGGVLLA